MGSLEHGMGVTWELVRKEEPQAGPQTNRILIWLLTRSKVFPLLSGRSAGLRD